MRFIAITAAVIVATGLVSVASCSSSNGGGGNNGTPDSGPKPVAEASAGDGGGGDDSGDDDSGLPPTPPAWDLPITQPTDTAAQTGRAACTYAKGAMPASTLGTSTPLDAKIPIDNIVVVMMENRSFDTLLGHLNEDESRTDVEEAPAGASNPDVPGAETGGTHPFMHAPHQCFFDTDHSWHGQHVSYDNGANDGFYFTNNGNDDNGAPVFDAGGTDAAVPYIYDGERAMWWYDNTDLPFEYSLANSFAVADHYFCSTLGPTYPNRDYLASATSFGVTENNFPNFAAADPTDVVNNRIITDELQQRHVSWEAFTDGTPGLATVLQIGIIDRYPNQTTHTGLSDFIAAAKAGTMPQVAFVDPNLGTADDTPTNNDQHPPSDVQIGSFFLQEVVNAVTTSPQWAHTALFITWDENGGEYDHVPPPSACAPDTTAPILAGSDVGVTGDFARLGFRVPLIVVSPYAKKGYVGHTVYDHTSITRFIEAKFKIPAMTARDANADPLMDMFDFTTPALITPPALATPVEDDAGLQYCTTTFAQ
jgi:phospholipase C